MVCAQPGPEHPGAMTTPDTVTLELRRNLARWAAMSPKAISEGSPAQCMYAMDDAQHDIAALASEIDRLRAENADLRLRLAGHRRTEQFRAGGRSAHVEW